MDKRLAVVIIFAAFLGSALTAFAQPLLGFTDFDKFQPWYREAVLHMNNLGIMKGYPDGSFQPGNRVNRAEIAVMLTKLEMKVRESEDARTYDTIAGLLYAQERLKSVELGKALYKNMLIMAEMNIRHLEGEPEEKAKLSVVNVEGLPSGYTIYAHKIEDLGAQYYVHFKGTRTFTTSERVISAEADSWYGPYVQDY